MLIRLSRSWKMRVFFDSNVFQLVNRVECDEWKGYVNDIVVSEVVYGYLRLAFNVSRYKLREYIIKHIDKVRELLEQDVYPLFMSFKRLPTSIGIDTLVEYMTKYPLLPNDALIAATCRIYGIERIATFDEDFRRVPWIKIVRETP
ncbi:MAG: ribonuclease VapC [Thermoprotei archaeon]|nr:MAG: ribonuclease VapC [Thermoprotei archaeon]